MDTCTPRITVAMSVYNNALFVEEAVKSILAQEYEDFELIIVNDGSTDGSAAILDQLALLDTRLRVIHQVNQGLIASLNRIIGMARGTIIARMDGDDISLPNRFSKQIEFLDANPLIGVLGTNMYEMNSRGETMPSKSLYPSDHESICAGFGVSSNFAHPTVMIRLALLKSVGGYRSAFRYCEDFDLWLRLSVATKFANLPDCLLRYRRYEGQVTIKHVTQLNINAAVALLAHRERTLGNVDPTDSLLEMPPLNELDRLFSYPGVARSLRANVVPKLLYSRDALVGQGFELIQDHIKDGGSHKGLWRTVLRLIAMRQIVRASRLSIDLAVSLWRRFSVI